MVRGGSSFVRLVRALVACTLVVFGLGSVASSASSASVPAVRGFDGTTITVAGYGIKAQLPTAEAGAAARFKRFNDTNELKGVKIDFTEFTDDGQDSANALSIERRLVTQTGVFAIVPNMSANNNATYLAQQQVPSFGGGFDDTYCSTTPSTKLWMFSPGGCITPSAPSFIADFFKNPYSLVSKKTGKKHPTWALIVNDNATGQNGARIFGTAAKGAGFDVVATLATLPLEVSDYTPYVQQLLAADGGKAPDAINCSAQAQCLALFQLLQANGYKGAVFTSLYTNILVKPLKDSYVNLNFGSLSGSSPALKQMLTDLDAYQSGAAAKVDTGSVFAYSSADMFIQALKQVAKKGKSNITPENIQKVASTMTWKLDGLMGPVQYPKATVMTYPACFSDSLSDGAAWNTVIQLSCSTKTFPPPSK